MPPSAAAATVTAARPARSAARAFRVGLADGATTTVYLAAYDLAATEIRVVPLRRPEPLAGWCRRAGVGEAIVGGFFVRPRGEPLGELRTAGVRRRSMPFLSPWDAVRACVHVEADAVTLAGRAELPVEPRGDLLQAGPLLVRDGRPLVRDGLDPEGFSAGSEQFDSDITQGRHPRAALGIGHGVALALACDGRNGDDAGLTLAELARLMSRLGAERALNLDGGASTALVSGGALVNRPCEQEGIELPEGRAVSTALVFRAALNGPRHPVERASADSLAFVAFRFYRRKSLGRGFWAGLSKSGPTFGRRGKRVSGSIGRRGPGGSIRLMKGLSYLFGRRR